MKFSFNRFSYLLRLQLAVNRKLYLLGITSIAGILLGFMFFLSYVSEFGYSGQEFTFLAGLTLSSTVFTSTIFKQFAQTDERTMAMMLPASAAERLAVAVLLTIVVYPLVYLLIAVPCILLTNYVNLNWNQQFSGYYLPNNAEALYGFLLNLGVQSCVLVGAIWFRRHVFVKSVIVICLFLFILSLVNSNSARKMIERSATIEMFDKDTLYTFNSANPFYSINLDASKKVGDGLYDNIGPYYHVKLPASTQLPFILAWALIPFILWSVTWMKIREQQL